MSLSDAYQALDDSFPSSCKTCLWYDQLSPPDRAFFDDKAAAPGATRAKLFKACKENGLNVATSSFRNHLTEHHARKKGELR